MTSHLLALLESVVNIQSGSHNTEGITKVQEILQIELSRLGFVTHLINCGSSLGPHLLGERLRPGRPKVVLDGHVDTVFPSNSIPQFKIIGERCHGQGVIDMKGGDICIIGILQELERKNLLDDLSIRVLFVSDEEIGSPSSRSIIAQLSSETDFALVFEEAGGEGEVVVGRLGNNVLEVTTFGVAGHAANFKGVRINAIEELSYLLCALREAAYELSDDGVIFSVGKISGGTAHNVIPDRASACMNIRVPSAEIHQKLISKFNLVASNSKIPGTYSELNWLEFSSPPMPVTDKTLTLFKELQRSGKKMGVEIKCQRRNGSSNANFWADKGIAVLDGLGPIGGDDHSDREWMLIPSLFDRIQLVSNFLGHMASI